ncbi:large subunit ribosomal protein L16 [Vigna unguiculata]|uniref:Large ribosomal subunit protein uL16m n=1 Tax=Vigna unguiculata TaxID=3917 RepID=A0A4D6L1I0_VIGUN|nr:large subunit ribosomal protein L16 [Vigna unguiculata]
MSGQTRKNGKIWVRVFADIPITGKPTEVRMGRGKGNPTGWIARESTGQVLFEMDANQAHSQLPMSSESLTLRGRRATSIILIVTRETEPLSRVLFFPTASTSFIHLSALLAKARCETLSPLLVKRRRLAFITTALTTWLNECSDATCVSRGFPQWNLSSSVYEFTVGRSQYKVDFWGKAYTKDA